MKRKKCISGVFGGLYAMNNILVSHETKVVDLRANTASIIQYAHAT